MTATPDNGIKKTLRIGRARLKIHTDGFSIACALLSCVVVIAYFVGSTLLYFGEEHHRQIAIVILSGVGAFATGVCALLVWTLIGEGFTFISPVKRVTNAIHSKGDDDS